MSSVDLEAGGRRLTRIVVLAVCTVLLAAALSGTAPPARAEFGDPPAGDPATVTADPLPTWQINGVVWSQVVVGRTVYVTGSFSRARPPGVPEGDVAEIEAANIFAYDITTGEPVPFRHALNAQGLVVRAAPDGQRIYVGGDFTSVDGQARQHVAAFDTATGDLVEEFAPAISGQVRGLAFVGATVHVGGNFREAEGEPRQLLAAFDAGTGAMTSWAPAVDNGYVWSMVASPDGSRVVVGGSFTTLNGVDAYGMGALDTTTGATRGWAANLRLRTAGKDGAITSLSTDGQQIYGTGYSFGPGATFEGTFAADPTTGSVNWVNDCLGDSYDIFAIGRVAYNVSHRHDCSNVGAFPDTKPRVRWTKASADRTFPIGTLTEKDAYGWDFTGLPYSGLLHWHPDLKFGTYTDSRQAAWTVSGNADHVVLGGEFPEVGGKPQQGLVRFARRPLAPRASKPVYDAAVTPTPSSTENGRVKVVFGSEWDRDDTDLTYDVYRSPGTRIASLTRRDSEFWKLPTLGVLDLGQTPGASVRYQVRVSDPDGNVQWSAWSPYVTVSGAAPSRYAAAVRSDGATHYWRLGERPGSPRLLDDVGHLHASATDATLGTAGAVPADTAATFTVGSTAKATTRDATPADAAVSVEAWVRTTSTRGGRIIGFGDNAAGTSTTGSTDRALYLDGSGRVNFTINDGSYRAVFGRTPVNDGQWHHLVGMVDAAGLQLFVDGARVGRDQSRTRARSSPGFWRLGADRTTGFVNRPADAALVGSIDEVAVYPLALPATVVRNHHTLSGRKASWTPAPSDRYGQVVVGSSPDLFWRLGEASGRALDSASNGATGNVSGGTTRQQGGPITGNKALAFQGTSGLVVAQQSWTAPQTYSAELWFKTTSRAGGKLIGFGNATSGLSTLYDRHVIMRKDGKLSFGTYGGARRTIDSSQAFNDGKWHHLVASQGASGMRLHVDNRLVGSNTSATAQSYLGYWRVGGDRTWGGTSSNFINGVLDEVAVYPRVLTATEIAGHHRAAGR